MFSLEVALLSITLTIAHMDKFASGDPGSHDPKEYQRVKVPKHRVFMVPL